MRNAGSSDVTIQMTEPYKPTSEPFWTDGTFQVHELQEGHYVASRINGAVHFRGSLKSCCQWIEREQKKGT